MTVGRSSILFVGVAAVVILALPIARAAMDELYLFSAVSGTVLEHGKPVSGAAVVRTYAWAWTGATATDTAHTDAEGRFTLPAVTATSVLGALLAHEPVVTQQITIQHRGVDYKAWAFTKHNYHRDGELGRPLQLTCRLEQQPVFRGEVFGICTTD